MVTIGWRLSMQREATKGIRTPDRGPNCFYFRRGYKLNISSYTKSRTRHLGKDFDVRRSLLSGLFQESKQTKK